MIGKRKSGAFYASVLQMKEELNAGGLVGIACTKEDDYIQRVVAILLKEGVKNIKWERTTRKEPHSPYKIIYDEWSEPIGTELVEQVDKFTGYKIWTHEQHSK